MVLVGCSGDAWTSEVSKQLFIPAALQRMDNSEESDLEVTPQRGKSSATKIFNYEKVAYKYY